MMKCLKCDKCGAVAEIPSKVTFRYRCEVNVADDCEPVQFVSEISKETFDLCESCAEEVYQIVRQRQGFPRRIL